MKYFINILLVCFITGLAISCKKDEKTYFNELNPTADDTPKGAISIYIANKVGTQDLFFGQDYVNPKGDTFRVSKFNYYISNLVFTAINDSTFAEPNSYHLVQQSDASSLRFTVYGVPLGSYKSLSFMLGVDSARNVSGAQTGALDPAKGMFWTWNTGYIFFKLEGSSPKSGDVQKNLVYHVGGYKGEHKGQRDYNFNFDSLRANVTTTLSPKIHLSVDVNKFFGAKRIIDVSAPGYYNHMMPDSINKVLADNYAEMFSIERIENN